MKCSRNWWNIGELGEKNFLLFCCFDATDFVLRWKAKKESKKFYCDERRRESRTRKNLELTICLVAGLFVVNHFWGQQFIVSLTYLRNFFNPQGGINPFPYLSRFIWMRYKLCCIFCLENQLISLFGSLWEFPFSVNGLGGEENIIDCYAAKTLITIIHPASLSNEFS